MSEVRKKLTASDALRRHKDEVIQHWLNETRRAIPAARAQNRPALLDNLPIFLDALIEALREQRQEQSNVELGEVSKVHGAQRAELGEYNLIELIWEYRILRRVLLMTLMRETPLSSGEIDVINQAIDLGIEEAAQRFSDLSKAQEREAKVAAESSLESLSALIQAAPVGITFVDREFRYVRLNEALARMNGAPVKEHLGRKVSEMVKFEISPPITTILKQVIESRKPRLNVELESIPRHEHESPKYFLGSYFPTRNRDGEVTGLGAIIMDVTERKLAERNAARQHRWLEAIMDAVPVPLFFTDPNRHQITFANRAAQASELALPEVLGKDSEFFYTDPQDRPVPLLNLPRVRVDRGEQLKNLELTAHFRGRSVPLLINGTLLPPMHGHQATGLIIFQNISERKRHESIQQLYADVTKLLAESLEYRSMLRKVAHAVLPTLADWAIVDSVDPETHRYERVAVASIDPRFRTIAEALGGEPPSENAPEGISKALRIGQSVICSNIQADPFICTSENFYAIGTTDSRQIEIFKKLGVSSYITVLIRARGRTVGGITLVRSAAERRYGRYELEVAEELAARVGMLADNARLYEESQTALARLQEEQEMREQFVMTLSHDLRTPLTAAKVSAQIIARNPTRIERVPQLAARINESLGRADRMIQDLLDASRLRAGKPLTLEITRFDIHDLAARVVEEVTSVHGKRIQMDIPREIHGHWSFWDLHRLLENLLTNALKYGAADTPVHLRVTQQTPKAVLISVHNYGSPIPPEEQVRIFDRFSRVATPSQSGRKGWGLGLTIVQGIARAHGGEVWLESSASIGTTFYVKLPLDARSAAGQSAAAS